MLLFQCFPNNSSFKLLYLYIFINELLTFFLITEQYYILFLCLRTTIYQSIYLLLFVISKHVAKELCKHLCWYILKMIGVFWVNSFGYIFIEMM